MTRRSKTPLFLMEVLIMLLVFSICAAVCLQLFAGAKGISEGSKNLDMAVVHAQKAAEYWKSTHGDLKETASLMGALPDEDGFKIYDEENLLHVEFTCKDYRADIVVLQGEKEVFSLTCEAVMADG